MDEAVSYEIEDTSSVVKPVVSEVVKDSSSVVEPAYRTYKVKKKDTLQKISKKFFGTTKKWYAIYELNKDKLKSPDKVFPGQIIRIPNK